MKSQKIKERNRNIASELRNSTDTFNEDALVLSKKYGITLKQVYRISSKINSHIKN